MYVYCIAVLCNLCAQVLMRCYIFASCEETPVSIKSAQRLHASHFILQETNVAVIVSSAMSSEAWPRAKSKKIKSKPD